MLHFFFFWLVSDLHTSNQKLSQLTCSWRKGLAYKVSLQYTPFQRGLRLSALPWFQPGKLQRNRRHGLITLSFCWCYKVRNIAAIKESIVDLHSLLLHPPTPLGIISTHFTSTARAEALPHSLTSLASWGWTQGWMGYQFHSPCCSQPLVKPYRDV